MSNGAVTRAKARADATFRALHSPNLDTLPPELIVFHVLPHLTNGEKGALANTCGRLFRLLRHERVYRLSSPYTRKYLEDATFCEEVKAHIPEGKLLLRPFECAVRALHFPPFDFKRARTLFEEVLADESATEVEKRRAHLSLYVMYINLWGGPDEHESMVERYPSASALATLRSALEVSDPVGAFEMGICYFDRLRKESRKVNARSFFGPSADDGCAAAIYILGLCLFYGIGAQCDRSAAAAQWERAAAMGHFGAMYSFGDCLFFGFGVTRDEARGVALVRSAAVDEGSWDAKLWLDENGEELKRKGL